MVCRMDMLSLLTLHFWDVRFVAQEVSVPRRLNVYQIPI